MLMETLSQNAVPFFLVFARVLAFMTVAPLLSSNAIPGIVRIVLGLTVAIISSNRFVAQYGLIAPATGLEFVLLLCGEALLGLIMGFFLNLIFMAFQLAGQFFSMPMGFSASQVFDPLAQIEIPVLGQLLNLFAMFVFLSVGGFRRLFFNGILASIDSLNISDLASRGSDFTNFLITGLASLFLQALVLAFPIVSTLFLISISLGLLAKAAPQMNLLLLGFPLSIGVGFLVMMATITLLLSSFDRFLGWSFEQLASLFTGGGAP